MREQLALDTLSLSGSLFLCQPPLPPKRPALRRCHGRTVGPDPFAQIHAAFLAAFPDLEVVIEEMIAEGDLVAIRWSVFGTHQGEFLDVKATGRQIQVRGTTWHRYEAGRLVEGWDCWNADGLLRQLTQG